MLVVAKMFVPETESAEVPGKKLVKIRVLEIVITERLVWTLVIENLWLVAVTVKLLENSKIKLVRAVPIKRPDDG